MDDEAVLGKPKPGLATTTAAVTVPAPSAKNQRRGEPLMLNFLARMPSTRTFSAP